MHGQYACRGAGIGLRPAHLREVLRLQPAVPWFEVHICNFLGGGRNRALLHRVREHYPLSFHGVNLNLGGTDPIDRDYLQQLKQAVAEFEPGLVSEHACFCAHNGQYFHDLLPVPFSEEAVDHMAARIRRVQDTLGRRIAIENVSRYVRYAQSQLSEGEFLAAVCERADCDLLLDLNNAYVNARNLQEPVDAFIAALPARRITEIHLAGYSEQDGRLIDTHSCAVSDAVWNIYRRYLELAPQTPCLIEWDSELPALPVLIDEQRKAGALMQQAQWLQEQWLQEQSQAEVML